MSRFLRKKKMVNRLIQGTMIARLGIHIFAYNIAILALIVITYAIQMSTAVVTDQAGDAEIFTLKSQLLTVGGAMLFMMPFIVFDLLCLSNRVAGPLYRFETILADFVKSGSLTRARIREGDLLVDFEKQFNEFVEAVHALYPETIPTATSAVAVKHTPPGNAATTGSTTNAPSAAAH
ncbi:MAG: hypothetical protein KDA91_14065 [Planctomycetaceae bacterium]|nr:hypothetical protein [Planctomycetaceae bacterium]